MALTKLNSYSLPDDAVTSAKIADDAVTSALIADNAITSAKIGVDVIVAEDLAANSITVSELTDGVITEAKLNIDNSPVDDRVLTAKASAAGGLTWAAAGGGGGGYSQSGSSVTPTASQNNIEFTIPSGTNRILVCFYGTKTTSSSNNMLLQFSDDTAFKTSGYHQTGEYTGGTSSTATSIKTDGAQIADWSNTEFYGQCEYISPDAGRKWTWTISTVTLNSTYVVHGYGFVDMGSGKDCRKLRFSTSSGGGFLAQGTIAVYYMEMGA